MSHRVSHPCYLSTTYLVKQDRKPYHFEARVRDHFEEGGGARQHLLGAVAAAAPLVRAYATACVHMRAALRYVACWAARLGVRLPFTLADDGGGGSGERRHDLGRLVRTLVRACTAVTADGDSLLPYTLRPNRTAPAA